MKEASLYNFYRGKMSEQNVQKSYNMAMFGGSYRSNNSSERSAEPILSRIECGLTQCRLLDDSGTIPDNIERCR